MPARKPAPADDAAQFERFKEVAREVGCDDDEEAFKAKLAGIAKAKPAAREPEKKKAKSHD